jgi:hypothetical protein
MPHSSTVKFNPRKGMLCLSKLDNCICGKILTVTPAQSCVGKTSAYNTVTRQRQMQEPSS